jgi:hypothetical protein
MLGPDGDICVLSVEGSILGVLILTRRYIYGVLTVLSCSRIDNRRCHSLDRYLIILIDRFSIDTRSDMASSLIRFSKFPSIAADRSIETFTKERSTCRLRLQGFTLASATTIHLTDNIRDNTTLHQVSTDDAQARFSITTGHNSSNPIAKTSAKYPKTTEEYPNPTGQAKPKQRSSNNNNNTTNQPPPRPTALEPTRSSPPLNLPAPNNLRPLRPATANRPNPQRSLHPLPHPLPLVHASRTRSRSLCRLYRGVFRLFAVDRQVRGQVWGCVDFHVPWIEFFEVSGLEVRERGDEQGHCNFGVGGCWRVCFGSGGVCLVRLSG